MHLSRSSNCFKSSFCDFSFFNVLFICFGDENFTELTKIVFYFYLSNQPCHNFTRISIIQSIRSINVFCASLQQAIFFTTAFLFLIGYATCGLNFTKKWLTFLRSIFVTTVYNGFRQCIPIQISMQAMRMFFQLLFQINKKVQCFLLFEVLHFSPFLTGAVRLQFAIFNAISATTAKWSLMVFSSFCPMFSGFKHMTKTKLCCWVYSGWSENLYFEAICPQ